MVDNSWREENTAAGKEERREGNEKEEKETREMRDKDTEISVSYFILYYNIGDIDLKKCEFQT